MIFHKLEFTNSEVQLYMYYTEHVVVVESKRSENKLELFQNGNRIFVYSYGSEDKPVGAIDMFVDVLHMCSQIISENYEGRIFESGVYDEGLMRILAEYIGKFHSTSYRELLESYTLIRDSIRKCMETTVLFVPRDLGGVEEVLVGSYADTTFRVEVYAEYIMYTLNSVVRCLHVDTLLAIFELEDSESEKIMIKNIYAKTLLPVLAECVAWRD